MADIDVLSSVVIAALVAFITSIVTLVLSQRFTKRTALTERVWSMKFTVLDGIFSAIFSYYIICTYIARYDGIMKGKGEELEKLKRMIAFHNLILHRYLTEYEDQLSISIDTLGPSNRLMEAKRHFLELIEMAVLEQESRLFGLHPRRMLIVNDPRGVIDKSIDDVSGSLRNIMNAFKDDREANYSTILKKIWINLTEYCNEAEDELERTRTSQRVRPEFVMIDEGDFDDAFKEILRTDGF